MEKPTVRQRFASFGSFIYNKDESTFLGRGARSWGEIGVFYLIYYICLSGFFAATIAVFYQTLSDDEPALVGEDSLLKGNPGIGIQPKPSTSDTGEISITSSTVEDEFKKYLESTKKALAPYKKSGLQNTDCSGQTKPRHKENIPCAIDLANITNECSEANAFGMKDRTPCILLKLNKVFGWSPKMWDEAEVDQTSLPQNIKDQYTSDQVWINCQGKKSGDRKKLEGVTIDYYPTQGFPSVYFPYKKQKDYLSPLVFARFTGLPEGESIKVECRAYARNINVDRTEKQGIVEFELTLKK